MPPPQLRLRSLSEKEDIVIIIFIFFYFEIYWENIKPQNVIVFARPFSSLFSPWIYLHPHNDRSTSERETLLSSSMAAVPSPSSPPTLSFPHRFRCREALFFLRNCSSFIQLKQIHAKIIRHSLSQDQLIVRQLLHLSSSFGETQYASLVFRQLRSPSTFTWNLMIRSLCINDKPREALVLFVLMISHPSTPDKFTFPFVIKACLASSSLRLGKQVHGLAVKAGFSSDVFLQNTLMDMYFKCGLSDCGRKVFEKMRVRTIVSWTTMLNGLVSYGQLDSARTMFNQMPTRNVVSWTAMITAYVKNQRPDEAFRLFCEMQVDNVRPNEFTLVNLLQASTQLGSLSMGRWVHDFAHKNGFPLDCFLGTALIDMYSKCGSLQDARKVFHKMQTKSLATWNAMITSLGVHGCGEEALSIFEQMELESSIEPDAITFVGVLSACVNTRNVKEGLKYFSHMTQHYGIPAIPEHYASMIQLLDNALKVTNFSDLADATPCNPNQNAAFHLLDAVCINDASESHDKTPSQHWILFSK
ncbi:PREDICTED: pentatricopeptide repeat-containing protein At3g26630, chloroplastic [Tarenaya hassleriana]|uniref:pentatricopeptide repeat-containing protein At3g26630, chloroplastic n=1 Tax=Tarenaya hassleriana TaxID=28532 RepID=UPI0008FD8348|nr:PREDICTED: pentatricopeptide repeat-containing protein At3g26630, chloroplastic [Tarenaya hassleriana]